MIGGSYSPWEVGGEVVRDQLRNSNVDSVIRDLNLVEYFGEDFVRKLMRLLR